MPNSLVTFVIAGASFCFFLPFVVWAIAKIIRKTHAVSKVKYKHLIIACFCVCVPLFFGFLAIAVLLLL